MFPRGNASAVTRFLKQENADKIFVLVWLGHSKHSHMYVVKGIELLFCATNYASGLGLSMLLGTEEWGCPPGVGCVHIGQNG